MRNWKVGTLTAGLSLIMIGVLWLGNQVWNISVGKLILNAWPILLILLGVEVLFHHFIKKDAPLKFDGFSIFLLIILTMVSAAFYGVQESGVLPAVKGVIHADPYSFDVDESIAIEETIEEIIIEIPNADLRVTGSNSNNMSVNGVLEVNAESEDAARNMFEDAISVKKVGKKLYYEVKRTDHSGFFNWNGMKAELEMAIPSDRMLIVQVSNGDVEIENLENGGDAELINGDLFISDVKGEWTPSMTNGSLELHHINGDLKVSNTNGDIEIDGVSGELKAESVNGSILIATEEVGGDWKADITNGDIEVELPESVDATVKGVSKNGKVAGDAPWRRNNDKDSPNFKKEGTLSLGEETYKLEFSSTNGEVNVDLNGNKR